MRQVQVASDFRFTGLNHRHKWGASLPFHWRARRARILPPGSARLLSRSPMGHAGRLQWRHLARPESNWRSSRRTIGSTCSRRGGRSSAWPAAGTPAWAPRGGVAGRARRVQRVARAVPAGGAEESRERVCPVPTVSESTAAGAGRCFLPPGRRCISFQRPLRRGCLSASLL
jgi:hypothetical protein